MNDTPTPETDAVHLEELDSLEIRYDLMHDLARRLERELAEARDTISDVMKALDAIEHEGPRLAALQVKGERDEAREAYNVAVDQLVVEQSAHRRERALADRLADTLKFIGTDNIANANDMRYRANKALDEWKEGRK